MSNSSERSLPQSHDTQPKRRRGGKEAAALFSAAVLAGAIGTVEASAGSEFPGQPARGALVNPNIFRTDPDSPGDRLTVRDVKYCQTMTTGINTRGNKETGVVYSPGVAYRVLPKRVGNVVRVKLGLLDTQLSAGPLIVNGKTTSHQLFRASCQAAVDTQVRVNLAKRNSDGDLVTVSTPPQSLEPLKAGFQSTAELDDQLGVGAHGEEGVPDEKLDWQTVRFPISSTGKGYKIKVTTTSKPDRSSPWTAPADRAAIAELPTKRRTRYYSVS